MAKHLGNALPPELLDKLRSGALYRTGGLGLPVLTVDEAGWPHVAMAPGAVAATPAEGWVALGGKTGSMHNIERDGKLTLLVAGPDTLYYIKGQAEIVRPEMQMMAQEAALRVRVSEVLRDMEPFVTITGGVSYQYGFIHEDFITVIGRLLAELQALAEGR
jgi:hypothetical protein